MSWNNGTRAGVAMVVFALAAVACTDSQQMVGPNADVSARAASIPTTQLIFDQVEFLGNPLVSEVTIVKANHDSYNKTQPYNTATFRPQTEQFVTSFGRPQALATTLGSVLYPDVLVVDPTKSPSTAGWLSWALSGGWGGRKLTDDVVDVGLTAIFSTFLSNESSAFCAPFTLPLCTDNINVNDSPFMSTFPYLAAAH